MSRKRRQKPKKSRSRFAPQKPKVHELHAKSNNTNIVHTFHNVKGWEGQVGRFVETHQLRLKEDLFKAAPFWKWLNEQTIDQKFLIPCPSKSYRGVFNFPPLDCSFSVARGGRFHIGSPQLTSFDGFENLIAEYALYSAQSIDCAKAEVGGPSKGAEYFEIIPKRPLRLWNLNELINSLKWPNLRDLIGSHPLGANWILQKTPLPSQLLGSYLRKSGGDGLVYFSAKKPEELIYCFFASDTNWPSQAFEAKPAEQQLELNIPAPVKTSRP